MAKLPLYAAAALLLSCAPARKDLAAQAESLTTIRAITDRGSTLGRHYVELWGNFPSSSYFGRVVCNGVEVPSRREYHGPERGQINVSIPEQPRGTRCSFYVGGAYEYTLTGLPPVLLREPPVDVVGVIDRGRNPADGKRYFELYGRLDAANMSAQVTCNGVALPTQVSWGGTGQPGNNQINVAISNFPAYRDYVCDFVVRGRYGNVDHIGPAFHHEAPVVNAAMPDFLGLYHWGNNRADVGQSQIAVGAEHVASAGFSTIRVVVTPRVRGELIQGDASSIPYNFQQSDFHCKNRGFLACAVGDAKYRAVLDDTRFRTVMLTAYDEVTSGEYGWSASFVDPAYMADTSHHAPIREEYRQLGYDLQRRYAGSGRTFIVTNWEADNSIFCGGVYGWSINHDNVRATCPSSLVWQRAGAMRTWFELRRDGLREGVARARAEGATGVDVLDGIEFSSYTLDIADAPRVLREVVIPVRPAVASYSSYDTINRLLGGASQTDVSRELRQIKGELLASPGTQLVIGEAGYNVDTGAQQVPLTVPMARAIHAAGIPTAILWVGFDSTPACTASSGDCRSIVDGFLDSDGSERWILKNLRGTLGSLSPPARARISSAASTAIGQASQQIVVSGSFPNAGQSGFEYRAKLVCNGAVVYGEPTVTDASQSAIVMNAARPICWGFGCSSRTVTCQASVYRKGTVERLDDFTQSPLSPPMTWTWTW